MLTRRLALSGLFSLTGCAPTVRRLGLAPAGFSGARLEPDALIAVDGARLPMEVWTPAEAPPWAALVALHGMNDYANAFKYGAPWWASQGVETYAYDQRGFGRTDSRGYWAEPKALAEDLRTVVALVRRRRPQAVIGVLGHSMGGAVAIDAFASDNPPAADRLILAAPAVWGWSRQSLPNKLALWISAHAVPGWRIEAPDWLARRIQASDNLAVLREMGQDRNLIFKTRIDAIYGLVGLMQRADRRIGLLKAPTLFLYGAHDEIIPKKAARRAASKLPTHARLAYYPNGWHLLNRDLQAPVVWKDILSFLGNPAAALPSGAPARIA